LKMVLTQREFQRSSTGLNLPIRLINKPNCDISCIIIIEWDSSWRFHSIHGSWWWEDWVIRHWRNSSKVSCSGRVPKTLYPPAAALSAEYNLTLLTEWQWHSPIMTIACSNIWEKSPEPKLKHKSNLNAQTASGACNCWPRIAFLLQRKDETLEDEISGEYGGWGNNVTWNSCNLSMVFVELWTVRSPRWINIRSIPLFSIMAIRERLALFRTILQSIGYLSCLLLVNNQEGTRSERWTWARPLTFSSRLPDALDSAPYLWMCSIVIRSPSITSTISYPK
jgi:hypothetical protein